MEYDIIIIGAGVVGAATARELSRWKLRTAVLEAKDDVACGTTKANSAIVHSGHSTKPGSLMAKYNVRGNRLYKGICDELDVPFLRNTHLMIGFSDDDIPRLQKVYDDGVANGVTGLKMLTRDETLALEPNLNPEITGSLLAETGAIVCPYELTIALAENANINGVEFHFNSKVTGVKRREDGKYEIMLADGRSFVSRAVLNAAGVHSDAINNFVSERKLQIIPRIGEYWMLDKNYASAF
ncbi:MAG: NAD(P)/FAD-dependent oxidoreductase, partial [Victivallales bacterium]|nr:NAD(P)/FAD-dependent oxidoreductase [Victivallales bacterium]